MPSLIEGCQPCVGGLSGVFGGGVGGMSLLAAFEMGGRGGIFGARSPPGGWGAGRTGSRGVNVLCVIWGRECALGPVSMCDSTFL